MFKLGLLALKLLIRFAAHVKNQFSTVHNVVMLNEGHIKFFPIQFHFFHIDIFNRLIFGDYLKGTSVFQMYIGLFDRRTSQRIIRRTGRGRIKTQTAEEIPSAHLPKIIITAQAVIPPDLTTNSFCLFKSFFEFSYLISKRLGFYTR